MLVEIFVVICYHIFGATQTVAVGPIRMKGGNKSNQKGGMLMLTIEGLIAVLSFGLTCFGIGYSIGKSKKTAKPEN